MILELIRDHFFGIFHWENQVGIIGGTRLGAQGTAAPQIHNTILYQVSKNPKGKPGWGKKKAPEFSSQKISSFAHNQTQYSRPKVDVNYNDLVADVVAACGGRMQCHVVTLHAASASSNDVRHEIIVVDINLRFRVLRLVMGKKQMTPAQDPKQICLW